MVGKM